jgi:hypothetical protein
MLIGASYNDIASLSKEREFLAVKDSAIVIQNELVLAAQVEDGYKRSITVPDEINGKPYTLNLINNSLTLSTDRSTYSVRIPKVRGTLDKGINNITKEANEVWING